LDFAWTEEQLAFRKEVIRFSREELTDDVIRRDLASEFSFEAWNKCAQFGIQALALPVNFGGGGADVLTIACALEGLGYACRDNGLIFAINAHMWGAEIPIWLFGTDDQQGRYLPKLASGEYIGAHAMSEAGLTFDPARLQTRAQLQGDTYVLNGAKTFISNATHANVIIVFASLEGSGSGSTSAFIVEKGTPGFTVSQEHRKMGLRTASTAELSFTDCPIPAGNLLGGQGSGQAVFEAALEWERICVLASYLGTMQRSLETSKQYASERKQFGQSIGRFPAVADKIVEMEVRLEAAKLLLYKAAWLKSRGESCLREASIVWKYLTQACIQNCLDAIQIHGGYGYMTEYQIERELRDAISVRIYSEAPEVEVSPFGFSGL